MKNSDLVSIITPAYNAQRFIDDTIKSVINQTYSNWEHLIVVDHNSKDDTKKIVEAYSKKDSRIKFITSTEALGAANNRNIALQHAKGTYIAFLDADDLWTEDKLEIQVRKMTERSLNFTFTSYQRINEDGSKIGQIQKVPEKVTYEDILKENSIACLTAMFRRAPFASIKFQEHGWEDMSFWLQILKEEKYAYSISKPLAFYRIVKGSRSNNKLFSAGLRWDTLRNVEKLSLPRATYLFIFYFTTSIRKYIKF